MYQSAVPLLFIQAFQEGDKGSVPPGARRNLLLSPQRLPANLSGGQQQRAALARILVGKPEILLLDEPFSALDFQTRLMLCDEMHDILKRGGKTVILVTHDISEAISMGDRVLVFSARPTGVKAEHIIDLSGKSPLERRNAANFKDYFNAIWGELDHDEAK